MDNISLGKKGEEIAHNYLVKNGYEIISQNYHTRYGEIDIIVKKNEGYVFVEVKSRRGLSFGTPSESVGYSKQQKLIKTAYQYIEKNDLSDCELRFDIIEVFFQGSTYKINQIEHAFYA